MLSSEALLANCLKGTNDCRPSRAQKLRAKISQSWFKELIAVVWAHLPELWSSEGLVLGCMPRGQEPGFKQNLAEVN